MRDNLHSLRRRPSTSGMTGREASLFCLMILWSLKYSLAGFTLSGGKFITVTEEVVNGTFVVKMTAFPHVARYEIDDSRGIFSIDTQGNVTVSGRIDREILGDRCDFSVRAYSKNGETAQQKIPCVILDVNDHAPKFPSNIYNISVNEKSSVGTAIFSETAIDEDIGQSQVTYMITQGNEDGVFGFDDPYKCDIVLMKELDFEAKTTYSLNITAKDRPGLIGWTQVVVNVQDGDDLPPKFSAFSYVAFVREDASIGSEVTRVFAEDQDKMLNAPITYELDKNPGGMFTVDNSSGTIHLKGSLDRENVSEYTLRVLAISTNHLPDHATVSVEVTDVNDNYPTFSQATYSAAIPEDSKRGSTILQVSAKDIDKGENATFSYSLMGDVGTFVIHSSSGFVALNGSLDRERKDKYTFVVIAEETETAENFQSNATVIIHVQDSNDNTPKFAHEFYRATVKENRPSETFVLQVSAHDIDLGLNGNVTYTIVPDVDGHYLDFTISPENGSIVTSKSLDRENISVYYLTVKATDSSTDEQTRSSTCQLKVLLEDANDNYPEIDKESYTLFISEATTVNSTILVIRTTDRDEGMNSHILYTLEGDGAVHSVFKIDHEIGALQVIDELDRETADKYTFVVKATDGGNKSTEVNVTVTLIDVNDNSPQFTQPIGYQFTAREEVEVVFLGNVSATDADIDGNAVIVYSLVPSASSASFRINSTTAELYSVAPLDRESADHHVLTVVAQDQGHPTTRSSLVRVRINVTDINDNRPRFGAGKYESHVLENQPAVRILVLSASDLDEGINSKLEYSIVDGNSGNKFRIDSNTGSMFTTMYLDREEQSLYNLTVLVSDLNGSKSFGHSLNDSATVIVLVQDLNDNSPIFVNSSYFVTVLESFPICNAVLQVSARDSDEYESIELSIIRGDEQGKFVIDKTTGKIFLQKELDYDPPNEEHSFELLVMALDTQDPLLNSTVNVTVSVSDVNDNAPVCSQDGDVFLVPEDSPRGMNVTTLHCKDRDSRDSGRLSYHVTSENNEVPRMFFFNETTQTLYLVKELDYDEGNVSYNIVLQVSDNGEDQFKRNMTIQVNVINVNDNAPTFSRSTYKFTIHEGKYLNSTALLGQVTASDMDADERRRSFGEIRFSILNSSDVFHIDPNTGLLSVHGNLDRENKSSHVLIVKATDSDPISPQSSTATVVVQILDENDNSPSFPRSNYVINVTEDVTIGHRVVKVNATDLDEGSNANITYEILSGNHLEMFGMNSVSGEIFVRSFLDRERLDSYSLVILARDGGIPPRVTPVEVHIKVLDINDNLPVCLSSGWGASVLENLPAGQAVAQVSARDADAAGNSVIAYNLSSDSFEVDTFTGLIRTTKSFDREMIPTYNLTVTAFNLLDHSKMANCSVSVAVLDANDNAPSFSQSVHSINVSEDVNSGTHLIRVTAVDSDSGRNGEVEYSLLGGNGQFVINHTTGGISTTCSLDRELAAQYVLRIIASDRGSPQSRSSAATLLVNVTDVNDNAPVFSHAIYTGTVLEGMAGPVLVAQVNATDADAGNNGIVTYSIKGSDADEIFTINPSGVISATMPLDRETRSNYELNVTARDGGTLTMSSIAKVVIAVEDINDNSPNITSDPQEIRISEETLPGALVYVVRAVDKDLGTNGVVRFSGFAAPSGKFAIDEKTGEIRTTVSLDRELSKRYIFYVIASDMGQPSRNSTVVSFNITLSDSNDNSPQFRPVAVITQLKESVDVGAMVVRVHASERDHGANAQLVYGIAVEYPAGHFSIDNQTGIISVRRKLDRETTTEYSLVVAAEDGGNSSRIGIGFVTVHINDENDNPPVFRDNPIRVQVQEDGEVGELIASITATDGDSDENAKIVYFLTDGGGKDDFSITTVQINASGRVQYSGNVNIAKQLDREHRLSYNLTILATDGVHNVTSNILIQVLDVNDNSPKFNTSYNSTVDINEDTPGGTAILQISADDIDDGFNAKITYFLEAQDEAFFIDSTTGTIYVGSRGLDRETRAVYNLTVTAADGGGRMVSRQVYFKIVDANDNVPLFNASFYSVSLEEGPNRSRVIVDINATDADEGDNGVIKYSIVMGNENDVFLIDSNTGLITNRKILDRDSTGQLRDGHGNAFYILTVEAADLGTPQQKSTAAVFVTVFDINDNPPVFEKSVYMKETADDLSVGSLILQVKATDKDWAENSNLTYGISDGDQEGVFVLDRFTGLLSLAKVLNWKTREEYNLTITAQDAGKPPLSATATVSVLIFPANRNAPRFPSRALNLTVKEDVLIGSGIAVINATRPESHGPIFYSLLSGGDEKFRVNTTNGAIITSGALDREERTSYELVVLARDDGPRPFWDSVTVRISVGDVNDNPPQFLESSYEFHVAENVPQEFYVGCVEAVDHDEGTNAIILFFIQGVESDSFSIGIRTGIIHTRKHLDREKNQGYNFTVVGRNTLALPNLYSEVTVTVIVTDVNDERPTFGEKIYETRVLESAAVGTSVIQVNVTDSDEDINSRIILRILYHQSSANSRHFAIDPEYGEITTQGQLDREVNSNYTLRIQARDLGNPARLANVVDVVIFVDDVNDNLPRFTYEYYRFQPNESSSVGDVVGKVEAIDIDEGENANVTHEIITGNDLGIFSIDEKNGNIYLVRALDREIISKFTLVVRAYDEQRIQKRQKNRRREGEEEVSGNEATVIIEVQDVNDNDPVFVDTVHIGGVYEDATNGVIVTVQATDKDIGNYSALWYSFVSSSEPGIFNIDSTTGEISANQNDRLYAVIRTTLIVAVRDNHGNVPYNTAKDSAIVYMLLLTKSDEIVLEAGLPLEILREKLDELKRSLENLTGTVLFIKNVKSSGGQGRSSLVTLHAVDDKKLTVLKSDQFWRVLLDKSDEVKQHSSKWNLQLPGDQSIGRAQFSPVVGAFLFLSAAVGVAGIVLILVSCRRKRAKKNMYKTSLTEGRFNPVLAWNSSVDIPGIEAYLDAKTSYTRRSLRANTKYKVNSTRTQEDQDPAAIHRVSLEYFNNPRTSQDPEQAPSRVHAASSTDAETTQKPDIPVDETGLAESEQEKPVLRPTSGGARRKQPTRAEGAKRAGNKPHRVRFDLKTSEREKEPKRKRRKVPAKGSIPDVIVSSEKCDVQREGVTENCYARDNRVSDEPGTVVAI